MFPFPFQPMGAFDMFVTGRSHLLLSERSISFNNVMITQTNARSSARIVEPASGIFFAFVIKILCICYSIVPISFSVNMVPTRSGLQ